ncbi:hypothetical protein [Sorangium sp. So ce861]|uniref:hypothetical protein n=1 Tax=Sorangium sp. So ce861 TaxID=3133323 RepID=UPI003F638B47
MSATLSSPVQQAAHTATHGQEIDLMSNSKFSDLVSKYESIHEYNRECCKRIQWLFDYIKRDWGYADSPPAEGSGLHKYLGFEKVTEIGSNEYQIKHDLKVVFDDRGTARATLLLALSHEHRSRPFSVSLTVTRTSAKGPWRYMGKFDVDDADPKGLDIVSDFILSEFTRQIDERYRRQSPTTSPADIQEARP